MPGALVKAVMKRYEGAITKVRCGNTSSESFPVEVGVHQDSFDCIHFTIFLTIPFILHQDHSFRKSSFSFRSVSTIISPDVGFPCSFPYVMFTQPLFKFSFFLNHLFAAPIITAKPFLSIQSM